MPILPVGAYHYEKRRHGELIEAEEAAFSDGAITGFRRSADGSNSLKVDAVLDPDGAIRHVRISYSRGFFKRDAVYEAAEDTLRGTVSAMAGRNEIIVKLGRLREIDAELTLFRALLISRVRSRGTPRWTGRVAIIDAATLVAQSLKQSCRALDPSGSRWAYEARMGDSETIAIDADGRVTERRFSDGSLTRLIRFTPPAP
jgi:hypothetical protein